MGGFEKWKGVLGPKGVVDWATLVPVGWPPGGWIWEKVENISKAKQTYASEIGIFGPKWVIFGLRV